MLYHMHYISFHLFFNHQVPIHKLPVSPTAPFALDTAFLGSSSTLLAKLVKTCSWMTPGSCLSDSLTLYSLLFDNSSCQVFQLILCTSINLALQLALSLLSKDIDVLDIYKGLHEAVNRWSLLQGTKWWETLPNPICYQGSVNFYYYSVLSHHFVDQYIIYYSWGSLSKNYQPQRYSCPVLDVPSHLIFTVWYSHIMLYFHCH